MDKIAIAKLAHSAISDTPFEDLSKDLVGMYCQIVADGGDSSPFGQEVEKILASEGNQNETTEVKRVLKIVGVSPKAEPDKNPKPEKPPKPPKPPKNPK
jgi:hypothetical protein